MDKWRCTDGRGSSLHRSLDLSFNSIRHISHLSHLANLHTLYLIQNKISRVRPDDLAPPLGASLRSLELGGNKLRVSGSGNDWLLYSF